MKHLGLIPIILFVFLVFVGVAFYVNSNNDNHIVVTPPLEKGTYTGGMVNSYYVYHTEHLTVTPEYDYPIVAFVIICVVYVLYREFIRH